MLYPPSFARLSHRTVIHVIVNMPWHVSFSLFVNCCWLCEKQMRENELNVCFLCARRCCHFVFFLLFCHSCHFVFLFFSTNDFYIPKHINLQTQKYVHRVRNDQLVYNSRRSFTFPIVRHRMAIVY